MTPVTATETITTAALATTGMVTASTETQATAQPPLESTVNILILGSDRRTGTTNWRTDVMMIVALDFARDRAGVISIPRDVYIDLIPNHQPNRMNVIDYLGEQDEPDGGGPALLSSIIAERMGIRIDHFLRFNFESFQTVVDALGGVEVDIDCPFREYFAIEDVLVNLKPGLTRLSGAEALVYVRSRRIGGDLERARRQQRFVWAVRNQMLKENLLPRVPALYGALKDSIQTDIGIVNAIRIVRFALALDEDDIHGFVLAPPDLLTSGWRSGMSIFLADWPAIQEAVQTIFER
ncbi:MAG: LCP family protein, partial [Caldilineaceae bacterium]|nr:LCP family protein [Caldilineaceae bacterium]